MPHALHLSAQDFQFINCGKSFGADGHSVGLQGPAAERRLSNPQFPRDLCLTLCTSSEGVYGLLFKLGEKLRGLLAHRTPSRSYYDEGVPTKSG